MDLVMTQKTLIPEKLKALYLKHRELVIYMLVGGGTTAVSWGCKYLCNLLLFGGTVHPSLLQNSLLSVVESLSALAYAYPANRKWVFRSKDPNIPAELARFTGSRMVGWILSWLLSMLLVNLLNVHVFLSTVLVGFVCSNISYFFSRRFVFRKNSDPAPSVSVCLVMLQNNAAIPLQLQDSVS